LAADLTPDFRDMTIDDLREGISTLNKIIKRIKEFQQQQNKKFAISWGAGTIASAAIALAFPPAAMMVVATTAMLSLDPAAGAAVSQKMLNDAESLRHKFKTVYRARPGRAFHDVFARREKEKARKKANRKFKFPGIG
jgi:hypothetical protein